jgi:hypothetical protein
MIDKEKAYVGMPVVNNGRYSGEDKGMRGVITAIGHTYYLVQFVTKHGNHVEMTCLPTMVDEDTEKACTHYSHPSFKILVQSEEDNKEVKATLYVNGKKIQVTAAYCHDDDVFSMPIGAKLAFSRLLEDWKWRSKHNDNKL